MRSRKNHANNFISKKDAVEKSFFFVEKSQLKCGLFKFCVENYKKNFCKISNYDVIIDKCYLSKYLICLGVGNWVDISVDRSVIISGRIPKIEKKDWTETLGKLCPFRRFYGALGKIPIFSPLTVEIRKGQIPRGRSNMFKMLFNGQKWHTSKPVYRKSWFFKTLTF